MIANSHYSSSAPLLSTSNAARVTETTTAEQSSRPSTTQLRTSTLSAPPGVPTRPVVLGAARQGDKDKFAAAFLVDPCGYVKAAEVNANPCDLPFTLAGVTYVRSFCGVAGSGIILAYRYDHTLLRFGNCPLDAARLIRSTQCGEYNITATYLCMIN